MGQNEGGKVMDVFSFLLMSSLFVLVDLLSLLVLGTFEAIGVATFETPDDPLNLVFLFLTMLVFTGVILLVSRFKKRMVHGLFLAVIWYFFFYTFSLLVATILPSSWSLTTSILAATLMVVALVKYPEWYVVDACGILMGVASITTLGVSLDILLVIILLVGMAVYDAVSVYVTKHMIDFADTVLTMRLPVMLVIPRIRNYSLIRETRRLKEEPKGERKAFFIGLGDIVFPGILLVSTFNNIGSNGLLVALSVMLGTLCGLAFLMESVAKGKPRAGLPYLCSGAILGYLVSSVLMSGGLVGI